MTEFPSTDAEREACEALDLAWELLSAEKRREILRSVYESHGLPVPEDLQA